MNLIFEEMTIEAGPVTSSLHIHLSRGCEKKQMTLDSTSDYWQYWESYCCRRELPLRNPVVAVIQTCSSRPKIVWHRRGKTSKRVLQHSVIHPFLGSDSPESIPAHKSTHTHMNAHMHERTRPYVRTCIRPEQKRIIQFDNLSFVVPCSVRTIFAQTFLLTNISIPMARRVL